ncbi:hypothetical protein HYH03_001061 [Edaphochlamys debaryana]|uniref:Protein kinase domain-containing protein n=1 Tax=Edaphochlamys debaryana TaxID=47281 RepID=A0A835YGD6_9CHLO|nr:hypothetical protein HYH03_001061 [Edaphochlamys debaryana]|eukprot:KAG2501254.1 hypothetical protein HYH03_001061 [Edaphochlamys debaryana]
MGNQASLPCCHSAADKYEAPQVIKQGLEVAVPVDVSVKKQKAPAEPEKANGEKPGAAADTNAAGPFVTTNAAEVAAHLAPQQGLPYQFHICGPPPPPCDEMRLRTINALKSAGHVKMDADAIDAPPDPEIASILKLVQSIFEAPAALVALFDDRRIFIRDAEGAFKRGDFPWRWSFCGWTMASKNDQIMVIPDATKDARFCNNEMVKSGPGVRFYCGTPLIASNGHRIGTLCFADTKPRDFDASRCVVLNNLAELVVRHLEKDIALQLRAHDNNNLMAAYGNLRRTLDCFDHCVVLVDVGCGGWRILFVNNPTCKVLGIERESLQGSYLSALLVEDTGALLPSNDHQQQADKGKEFQVVARLSAQVIAELDDAGKAAVGNTRYQLTFRPASREDLDEGSISIGVPSFIPTTPKKGEDALATQGSETSGTDATMKSPGQLYFMLLQDYDKMVADKAAAKAKAVAEMRASNSLTPGGSSTLSSGIHDKDLSQPPETIGGLTMGHLLGKGAYGSVYYGTWYGSAVAVKIIDEELPPTAESIAPPIEAILSKELRHPHIVATLRCARRMIGPSGTSTAVSSQSGLPRASRNANSSMKTDTNSGNFSDDTAHMSQSTPTTVTNSANVTTAINSAAAASNSAATNSAAHVLAELNAAGAPGSFTTTPPPPVVPLVKSGPSLGAASASEATPLGTCEDTSAFTAAAAAAAQALESGDGHNSAQPTALKGASSSSTASQGWAVIDFAQQPVPRRRSTARTEGPHEAKPELAKPEAEAGAGVGAVAVSSPNSTDDSEAYDDFDAGHDSNMSPFLMPPGSKPVGSGIPHSGASGSGKWQAEDPASLVRHQTWLIMEYCDRGCLQDAIDRGWLRTAPHILESPPRMDALLATAVELASALSFLHGKDIVHGDLSAWNVMLCTSGSTASAGGRGFAAKIADFGLARHLDIRTKIQTRTYGTLTHMPAETLRDGVISKATDVYSLGVLLWQLYTSSRPWAGLRHGQIIVMVVTQGARLRFPEGAPPAYESLAMRCMETDPRNRPVMEDVLAELDAMRKTY